MFSLKACFLIVLCKKCYPLSAEELYVAQPTPEYFQLNGGDEKEFTHLFRFDKQHLAELWLSGLADFLIYTHAVEKI